MLREYLQSTVVRNRQWAEYEIEMAVVAASLINIIAESENN